MAIIKSHRKRKKIREKEKKVPAKQKKTQQNVKKSQQKTLLNNMTFNINMMYESRNWHSKVLT